MELAKKGFLVTLLFLVPSVAFAFDWKELLSMEFWTPYAAILLALSEWLGSTDFVKSNSVLQFLVNLVKKAFKKETEV